MLFPHTLPIKNWISSRLRGLQSLDRTAVESEMIQGEEVQEIGATAFLPSQLEKPLAASVFTPLAAELEMAHARQLRHSPVIRYTLRDAIVHPCGFDVNNYAHRNRPLRDVGFLRSRLKSIPHATNCMSPVAHTFFGHWLQDGCSTALLADPNSRLLLDLREDWPNSKDYARAFDFDPLPTGSYHVETLHVFQDFSQGSSKRARYQILRDLALRYFGRVDDGPEFVYFRRGQLGAHSRQISNEREMTDVLEKKGFVTFDLEGARTVDIHRIFQNAKLVVGVEGSHLNHLYFSVVPGAALVSLVPCDRFVMSHVGYAASANVRFGFMVMDGATGGYQVNLDDLLRTIDLVWQAH